MVRAHGNQRTADSGAPRYRVAAAGVASALMASEPSGSETAS